MNRPRSLTPEEMEQPRMAFAEAQQTITEYLEGAEAPNSVLLMAREIFALAERVEELRAVADDMTRPLDTEEVERRITALANNRLVLGHDDFVREVQKIVEAQVEAYREAIEEHRRKMGGNVWCEEAQACWAKASARLWEVLEARHNEIEGDDG